MKKYYFLLLILLSSNQTYGNILAASLWSRLLAGSSIGADSPKYILKSYITIDQDKVCAEATCQTEFGTPCAAGGYTNGCMYTCDHYPQYCLSVQNTALQVTKVLDGSAPYNQGNICPGSVIDIQKKSVSEQIRLDGVSFSLNYSSNFVATAPINRVIRIHSPFELNESFPQFENMVFYAPDGVSQTAQLNGADILYVGGIPKTKYQPVFEYIWDGHTNNISNSTPVAKGQYNVQFLTSIQNAQPIYKSATPLGMLESLANYKGVSVDQVNFDIETRVTFSGMNIAISGNSTSTLVSADQTTNPGASDYLVHSATLNEAKFAVANTVFGEVVVYQPEAWGLKGWTISIHHYLDLSSKTLFKGDGSIFKYKNIGTYSDALLNRQVYYVHDQNNSDIYYVFDGDGRHLQTRSMFLGAPKAAVYSFTYNADNTLSKVIDVNGNETVFQYGSNGIEKIISPFGQQTLLGRDTNDKIITVTNSLGKSYEMTYYSNNLLKTFKSLTGEITEFEYDSMGQFVKESKNTGLFQRLSGNLQENFISTVLFNELGEKLKRETYNSIDGVVTDFYKNIQNEIVSKMSYLTNGDLRIEKPGVSATTVFYAPADATNPITLVNSDQAEYSNNSDQVTATKKIIYLNPAVTGGGNSGYPLSYGDFGVLYNDRSGVIVGRSWDYDINEFARYIRYFSGHDIAMTDHYINANGTVRKTSDVTGANHDMYYDYNSRGQLIKKYNQYGYFEEYEYDQFGYLALLRNSKGQVTQYLNNSQGNVLTQTLPNNEQIKYEYTDAGSLKKLTTPAGQVFQFEFDLGDYVNQLISPDHQSTRYVYDNTKRLQKIIKPSGRELIYRYDTPFDRVKEIVTDRGVYKYENYDLDSKPATLTSDDEIKMQLVYLGPKVQKTTWLDADGSEIGSIKHDFNNELFNIKKTYINNQLVANYSYKVTDSKWYISAINQVQFLEGSDSSHHIIMNITGDDFALYRYDYAENGQRLFLESANIFTPAGFANILMKREVDMDGISNGFTQYNYITSTNQYNTYSIHSPTYDSLNRLIGVKRETKSFINGQLTSQLDFINNYSYPIGSNNNMKEFTQSYSVDGGPVKRTVATHSDDDRLLTLRGSIQRDYTYNTDGDIKTMTNCYGTTTYDYDIFGNLKKVTMPNGSVIEYKVDALNRRVKKIVNGQVKEYYLWYDQIHLAAILDANKQTKITYLYNLSEASAPSMMIKDGITYKFLHDPVIGSIRYAFNTADKSQIFEIEYDEYGNILNNSNGAFQPILYAGGLYDSDTKLYRFGARDYDPTIGRWLAKDPIGFAGGDTNLYAYVRSNPMSYADPTGYCPWCVGAAIGGIFGGATSYIAAVASNQTPEQIYQATLVGATTGAVAGATGTLFARAALTFGASLTGQSIAGALGAFNGSLITNVVAQNAITGRVDGSGAVIGAATQGIGQAGSVLVNLGALGDVATNMVTCPIDIGNNMSPRR